MSVVYIWHLTVQLQREETLPIEVTSCPITHRCKVIHPTDFNGVMFSLHDHLRAELATVWPPCVTPYWQSYTDCLPNAKLIFNIVLKACKVVHNFIGCLLNWIADSKLLISFNCDLLIIQKMQAKSVCNTCYKFLYSSHKMHCWSRLRKLNEHTCFSLKISIPDNFILTSKRQFCITET